MAFINKSEIRIINLGRSGSHAVINWIMKLTPKKCCFLNNAKPHKNPFLSSTEKDIIGLDEKNFYKNNGEFTKKDLLMYSFEECDIKNLFNQSDEKLHDNFVGKSEKRYDVIILRDPFNFFASRLKLEEYGIRSMDIHIIDERSKRLMMGYWKDYAKEFLGYTNYLKHNKVPISYNKWFSDENYKKDIAKKLGLKYMYVEDKYVSRYGPGSSFDKRKFDGKAKDMRVLERWKVFKDYPFYRGIFKDKEIWELSGKIFGKIEGTEVLLKKQSFLKKALFSAKFLYIVLKGRARYYTKKVIYLIFPIKTTLS